MFHWPIFLVIIEIASNNTTNAIPINTLFQFALNTKGISTITISNTHFNQLTYQLTNDDVIINIDDNSIYSSIEIINYGETISKKDIKHIFERFYKGVNSKSDSIGIGLALSKTIIEEDNGKISVESNNNETIFTIKYFKL